MCRSHQSVGVIGSIHALLVKNTDTAIVGDRWTRVGAPRPVLLTGAKKSHLGCLISFELPMGSQNFVVINKIHPLKKKLSTMRQTTESVK